MIKDRWLIKRIESLCEEKRLSFREMLDLTNISYNAYQWKNGNSVPSLFSIKKICDKLEISLDKFFEGYDDFSLTASQTEFLREWRLLTEREKETILKVVTVLLEIRKISS